MSSTFQAPLKDPAAILVHSMDWSQWLDEGETITAQTVTASPDDLVIDQVAQSAGVVRWRVSAGTAKRIYTVTCQITTSAGRREERSVRYRVGNR